MAGHRRHGGGTRGRTALRPTSVTKGSIGTWLALALVAALFLLHGVYDRLAFYDEGIVLAGADRVLAGEAPYVDFWTIYPPGQFYALAAIFEVAGRSVLVERLYDLVVKLLIALVAYKLVRDLAGQRHAVAALAMMLIWLGYSRYSSYPTFPALLAVLVGVLCLLRHLDTERNRWLLACGLSVVVAVLFRHDVGGVAGIAFAALLAARGRWGSLARYCALGIVSAALVWLLASSAFGGERLIAHLFEFPFEVYPEYRWVPYPRAGKPGFLAFYVFPAVVLAGLLTAGASLLRHRLDLPLMSGIACLSLFGTLSLALLRVRSDDIHLLPCAVAAIALAPLLHEAWSDSLGARLRLPLAVLMAAVMATGLAWAGGAQVEMFLRNIRGMGGVPQGLRESVAYVQERTSPSDPIYSGVTNHDQFVVNGVAFNFLARRPYATRYHELHPGLTTTEEVQEEMVAELERTAPPFVVLATHNWHEPNLSNVDSGVDRLDRYLRRRYALDQAFGLFEVWARREDDPRRGD